MGLIDIWRELHPTTKEYTFVSNAHQSYSRLIYIFMSQGLRGTLQDTKILPLSLSDHSPVAICLHWGGKPQGPPRWYFPASLTRDSLFRDELREAINEYFQINVPQDTSPQVNWDAFKAVLQGKCITLSSALNKQRANERCDLEATLSQIECEYTKTPTRPLKRQLSVLKEKLGVIYTNRAELTLLQLRRNAHAQGNKVGTHLARQLREKREKENIGGITGDNGEIAHEDQTKANIFGKFYQELYTAAHYDTQI